jgi:hypothetical protein
MIRYDGLYAGASDEGERLYLRFYDDGTVLEARSGSDPDEVFAWLEKGKPEAAAGVYRLKGEELAFSTESGGKSVEYRGEVRGDRLTLLRLDPAGSQELIAEYQFIEVFPALFEGEPLFLQVRCMDAIRFEDGTYSEAQEWVFYLKAPSAWVFAPSLRERVTRLAFRIYAGLNWQSGLRAETDDGNRYELGAVEVLILSNEDAGRQPWRGQPLYILQKGGSVHLG